MMKACFKSWLYGYPRLKNRFFLKYGVDYNSVAS